MEDQVEIGEEEAFEKPAVEVRVGEVTVEGVRRVVGNKSAEVGKGKWEPRMGVMVKMV